MDGPLFGMFTNFVKSCNLNVIGRKKKKKKPTFTFTKITFGSMFQNMLSSCF